MKVLIAGCGGQGSCSAGLLAQESDVEQIICADQHLDRAQKLVNRLAQLRPGIQAKATQVDLCRKEDILPVTRGVDIVLNTGYPVANVPILRSCLEAGAHYLDLASWPFSLGGVPEEVTMDALLAFDDEAKARGITAITNAGCSPGFTDILVHHMADQMDTVDKIIARYVDRLEATDLVFVSWAWANLAAYLASPLMVWNNGKLVEKGLLESREEYEFPRPIGKAAVYTVTFPELATITRYLPEATGKNVKYVELKGGLETTSMSMEDIWVEALNRVCKKMPEIEKGNLIELMAAEFIQPSDFESACKAGIVSGEIMAVAVEMTGQKNGRTVCQTVTGMVTLEEAQQHIPWTNALSYFTALNAVVTALMISRGRLKRPGVGTAWHVGEPAEYLKEVERRGVRMIREEKALE
jgi:saccharopine dehydrogenase-like NADP-dependent oxidoreductase